MAENLILTDTLKKYFGFDTFKGDQEQIIQNLLDGNDTFVLIFPKSLTSIENRFIPTF